MSDYAEFWLKAIGAVLGSSVIAVIVTATGLEIRKMVRKATGRDN